MTTLYGSGPGYALVTPDAVVVLGDVADAGLVQRLWTALGEGDPGPRALRELVSAAGGDFDAICPFALVLPAGPAARVVVRGSIAVTVHGAAGDERLDGAHVVTWAEREVVGAHAVSVTLGGPIDDARLPIGLGVVRAGIVVVGEGAPLAAAATEDSPEPLLAPVSPVAPPGDVAGAEGTEPPVPVLAAGPGDGVPASTGTTPATSTVPSEPPVPAPDGPEPAVGEGTTWGPAVTLVDYVPLAAPAPRAEPEHTYDDLFGPTRIHAVEEAAVRTAEEQPPTPAEVDPADEDDVDHDHRTVVGVRRRREATALAPAQEPSAGPSVLGRRCDAGHDNPPTRTTCRVCGGPVAGALTQVARPALGRMRFASGAVVDLDAPVVLGRRPRVARVSGEQLPRVITLPSPLGEISGSHLAVRLEEWLVLAVDLDSSNGTMLLRPGAAPRRLAPQQPEILRSGDVLDLGDGAAITFEDVP